MTTHEAPRKPLKTSPLPAALPPRGLSREQAASYIGVGVTTFDRLIRDGLMPKPLRVYGRRLWDRIRLDAAFSALCDDGEEDRGGDVWDRAA
jgi:hypothetical protein